MDVDLLHAAIGFTWVALALVLVRVRLRDDHLSRWLYVGIFFCVLRAADFILVQPGIVDGEEVVLALDGLVLVTLVLMVFAVERLRRGLTDQHEHARHARAEYSRALLDYTQLVRHRIANPLTAVIGGAQTLLDLDLPDATKRQLLEAMLDSARRLERVALHPELVSPEEAGLHPAPAPLADPRAREALEQVGGEIESDFRDVNVQLLEALPDGHGAPISFVCECSARECAQPVIMTLLHYNAVHMEGTQFVVAPGHDMPAIEDVIDRQPGWWVVRKRGPAAVDARRRSGVLDRLGRDPGSTSAGGAAGR